MGSGLHLFIHVHVPVRSTPLSCGGVATICYTLTQPMYLRSTPCLCLLLALDWTEGVSVSSTVLVGLVRVVQGQAVGGGAPPVGLQISSKNSHC